MANYQVENVGINIVATVEDSVKALDKLLGKIGESEKNMGKFGDTLDETGEKAKQLNRDVNSIGRANNVQRLTRDVENLRSSLDKTESTIKKVTNVASFALLGRVIRKVGKDTVRSSLDSIAATNLFNASMGEGINVARDFQGTIQSAFQVASTESMRIQGYFQTLVSSLRIGNAEATLMSENLTKLAYDLSSLFGVEVQEMYSKMQSGMIGQTKPLRNVGIDVTAQTLQTYLNDMGIDAFVNDLTQAEKVLLRYIAILDQSSISHGHMAKTIESPINQVRVLKAQVAELGMYLSHVFMGTIGRILPYINGFVMALKEMAKALAMLFGVEFNTSVGRATSGVQDLGAGIGNVGSGLKKATKQAKKLAGVFSFDELHIVETPTESPSSGAGGGGGVGGGVGGAYYDQLVDALSEYDNLMGSVNMKAKSIRDKILEMLGFTWDINEITGEIENLQWGGLSEMHWSLKLILGTLVAIQALKLITKAMEWYGWLQRISGILGGTVEPLTNFEFGLLGLNKAGEATVGIFGGMGWLWALVIGWFVAVGVAIAELMDEDAAFKSQMIETWEGIKDTISRVYNATIAPILETIGDLFDELWNESVKPFWEEWKVSVKDMAERFSSFFETIKPLLDILIEIFQVVFVGALGIFGGVIVTVIDTAIGVFTRFFILVNDIITSLMRIFEGFIDLVVGLFTGDWKRALEGAGNMFGGFKDIVLGIARTVANGFIDMINSLIKGLNFAIRQMNKIKFPDWVPGIGGKGIDISPVETIPRFATGGFPEDGLFFANSSELVGKFTNGRTAVANNEQIIEGIKQGVKVGVIDAMQVATQQDGTSTVNVYLDSKLIAKEQKNRELELEMVRG